MFWQGAIKDLKDILETLKANSEINHEEYPTSNPIQERQPSRGSDKTPSKMSSQHQFTADNSRVGTALGSLESFLNAPMNRSSSMNIIMITGFLPHLFQLQALMCSNEKKIFFRYWL